MKIAVGRLREALTLLGPVVPKNHTVPALTGVLLQDDGARATNLEQSVTVSLPEIDGECLLPYRAISDLVKRIPWNEMLTIDQDGKKLSLAWPNGKMSVMTHQVDDYPALLEVEAKAEHNIDGDTLLDALLSVVGYCATETTRPVLTGVCLAFGEGLTVAGADGYRMAYQTVPIPFPSNDIEQAILPAAAVALLSHLWRKASRATGPVDSFIGFLLAKRRLTISLDNSLNNERVKMELDGVTMVSRLIAGEYPNYLQLVPSGESVDVKAFAEEFDRAVRNVSQVARTGSGIVRLNWTADRMAVSAMDGDEGEIETAIPVEATGSGFVAMNVKYLQEYLKGKDGIITMSTRGPDSPITFLYRNSPLVVVMPMFVKPGGKTPEPAAETAEPEDEAAEPEDETPEAEGETAETEAE